MSPHPPLFSLRRLAIAGLSFLAAMGSRAEPSAAWSQGDPSAEEQQAMEWLNAARRDPAGTLHRLLALQGSDAAIAAFVRGEQPATPAQLEETLRSALELAEANAATFPSSSAISSAPLAFYPLLQQQAVRWSAGANLPAPSVPAQRPLPDYLYPPPTRDFLLAGAAAAISGPDASGGVAVFGPGSPAAMEVVQTNLYTPLLTGREYVLSLLCAPGSGSPPPPFLRQGDSLANLTLGHVRLAGLDISPGADGARVLTICRGNSEFFTASDLPFGNTGTVFITGVAYRDRNANGAYDPGEGLAGVRIVPDHGDWLALSATAGGYAIPVPADSGSYTLTASGPFAGATATVSVGRDNIKLDWTLPAEAPVLPPQIEVAPPEGQNQLIGLSTRGLVQTGASSLIGGFVIAGPEGAQKRLLIRGVGPSLQTAGIAAASCVPATQLRLYAGGTLVAANSGWTSGADGGAAVTAAAAAAGDFPLVNWAGSGGDSALVATLGPGAYTAVVAPADGAPPADQTGHLGLVEIYDLTPGDGSRLVNLSTRGFVGTGPDRLVVGCTVAGQGQARLLLRGVGPALGSSFGLEGVLPHPVLTLFDGAGATIGGDDQGGFSPQAEQSRALAATAGAFALPEGGADATLVARVPPGNYTAAMGAKVGTEATGLGLVEIYEAR